MPKLIQIFHVDVFNAFGIANYTAKSQDSLDSIPEPDLSKSIVLLADKALSLADYGVGETHWQRLITSFKDMRFRILYDDNEPTERELRNFAKKEFPAIKIMAETIMRAALDQGMDESCIYNHSLKEVEILVRKYFDEQHSPC